jgi:AAA15 family ATPase/GTPase
MYIQKAEIKNIRSIIDFEIEFKNPAGWHVLIGDNGAGKSTIIRSMALVLVGEIQAEGLRQNWGDWLNEKSYDGKIKLDLLTDHEFDSFLDKKIEKRRNDTISIETSFHKSRSRTAIKDKYFLQPEEPPIDAWAIEGWEGFFSAAYGPYRRFKGGSIEWNDLFKAPNYEDLAAHLSVFDESVALNEAVNWLQELNYKGLEKNKESQYILENLKKLINSEDFLPHSTKLDNISSGGVFFKDGNNATILVNQMSDGYRSILSMTFELIRQLVRVYGSELVFKNIETGEMFIDLPGVVLVDEIDAHLHPTWQTRIGQWFLKYFPKLQFIVTTHSPLVCRAAERGSIWRLAAPGSDEKSGEITGLYRERLIYGNVLDAYGTEVFGENVSISPDSNEMLNRLSELNVKSMMGLIEDKENEEMQALRAKFPTEDKTPTANISAIAPSSANVHVNPDKIKKFINLGEIIQSIAKDVSVNIDIQADGSINISAADENIVQEVAGYISEMSDKVEIGETYLGTVTRIVDFGAFVEIFPGLDGLLHISEISDRRIKDVRDELKEGQQVMVKCIGKEGNKVKLSRKATLNEVNVIEETL